MARTRFFVSSSVVAFIRRRHPWSSRDLHFASRAEYTNVFAVRKFFGRAVLVSIGFIGSSALKNNSLKGLLVPRLTRITIYPVKSLDGVDVDESEVLANGALAHDRRWALVDQSGAIVNGKGAPAVHQIRFQFDLSTLIACLRREGEASPARFHIINEKVAFEAWLSAALARPVALQENVEGGFPDDTEYPGPTVIGSATLQAVADWFGLNVDEARRRFRANLEIGDAPPFWEDQLFAERGQAVPFQMGGVTFAGMNPCQRCSVPSRSSRTGEPIPGFAKAFAERRRSDLPDWANQSRFDHHYRLAVNTALVGGAGCGLRVGDAVGRLGAEGGSL